jgi:hypothetical protein
MLPTFFDVDSHIDYLLEEEGGRVATAEELDSALPRVGRVYGPTLLSALLGHDLITGEDLTRLVGVVWSMAEYPDDALGHERWLELFTLAGYTVDGVLATRPSSSVTLYRGSVPERRADWSWTDSLDIAQSYAHGGIGGRPQSTVWTAEVDPARLLARISERDEDEYVVNTADLPIHEHH